MRSLCRLVSGAGGAIGPVSAGFGSSRVRPGGGVGVKEVTRGP